jgi:CRISPR-associated protein (TIGR02710 family)
VRDLSTAFEAWDAFRHKEAADALRGAVPKLEIAVQSSADKTLTDFLTQIKACLDFLNQLQQATRGFAELHMDLVSDLVANAERRAQEQKYDDATARLYRALEMIGQINLKQALGCDSDKVPIDKIPAGLRPEFERRLLATDSRIIKLGLCDTFRTLNAAENPAGRTYFEDERHFGGVLKARNESILAHGTNPIRKETFGKLRDLLVQRFDLKPAPPFPKLPW